VYREYLLALLLPGQVAEKTWSKRPLRMISAGSISMRLAVAATKTSGGFSCIQVRKAPNAMA